MPEPAEGAVQRHRLLLDDAPPRPDETRRVMTTAAAQKPAVLDNKYPVWDSAGNKMQFVRLRFACGHEESYYSLDMGRGWKPRTNRQLFDEHLRITCPMAYTLCKACSEAPAP